MFAPRSVYPDSENCIVIVYDVRDTYACEALHRARATWREHSHIEALDEVHYVLILRPGSALEVAA